MNGIQWMTMDFTDFKGDSQSDDQPYLHINDDYQFRWDIKDDLNDKDNGFMCKKVIFCYDYFKARIRLP